MTTLVLFLNQRIILICKILIFVFYKYIFYFDYAVFLDLDFFLSIFESPAFAKQMLSSNMNSSSGPNQGWTAILGSGGSEPSVNQGPNPDTPSAAGSSNSNHAGPSSIPGQDSNLSYTVDQPGPELNPCKFYEIGERGDLLRSLQSLVAEQLKHYVERGLPQWRHSKVNDHFDSAAHMILWRDMEVEKQSTAEIRELLETVRIKPKTFDYFYKKYKKENPTW